MTRESTESTADMSPSDANYVKQGFKLPEGMTWEDVRAHRQKWDIDSWMVPVAKASGVLAWGVPIRDGKFLKRLPTRPNFSADPNPSTKEI